MKINKILLWIEVILLSGIVGYIGYILAGKENWGGYVHEYVLNLFTGLAVLSSLISYVVFYFTNRKGSKKSVIIYLIAFFILSCTMIFVVENLRFNEHMNFVRDTGEFDISTGTLKQRFSEKEVNEANDYWKPMYFEYFTRYSIIALIKNLIVIIIDIILLKKTPNNSKE